MCLVRRLSRERQAQREQSLSLVAPDLAWPGDVQVEVGRLGSPISKSLAVAGSAPSFCHSAPTYGTELKQRVPANVLV